MQSIDRFKVSARDEKYRFPKAQNPYHTRFPIPIPTYIKIALLLLIVALVTVIIVIVIIPLLRIGFNAIILFLLPILLTTARSSDLRFLKVRALVVVVIVGKRTRTYRVR